MTTKNMTIRRDTAKHEIDRKRSAITYTDDVTVSDALPVSFFERPVLTVAPELIGMRLVRRLDDGTMVDGMITEVEAYDGSEDKACHAHKGMTERTKVMFGPACHWYVYLCYGMHWLLNIVTCAEGYPAAVLIRGVGQWNGPAKLTKAMNIDKRFNASKAVPESGLWIATAEEPIAASRIERTPRIGVDYAGEWAEKPYRFVLSS